MSGGPRLIGMVHLPALPGSPAGRGRTVEDVVAGAVRDARTLHEAGFDGLLVQNSLDRPTRERVDAATIAQLTAVSAAVKAAVPLPIGVNIVKNDGPGALAVAAAVGAEFVRVKILAGAVLSAEGIVHSCGWETMALRDRLGVDIPVWADVYEPTSRPLLAGDLVAAAVDAVDFGLADGLIITQPTAAASLEVIRSLRGRLPSTRMIIGGRVDASNVAQALDEVDSVIIGSALKRPAGIRGPVAPEAARQIADAARTGVRP
ncbi:MAG TPA: BtpA/SgcQ family protein [Amycolatopsis sp.]|nr:BtpA/SgcQ family protein [Amycolatopsis sp.]